jgi:hypothetical protein
MLEEWISEVFLELTVGQQEIGSNQDKILQQLEDITGRLQTLDAKLDEETLRSARTGVRYLIDGVNSDIEDVKSDELLMARQEFGKLVHLDSEGITKGTSGQVDNKHLIAIGHWGNSHYFNIRGDMRNAAIQVYECTAKFPIIGLVLFSSHFFTKDYGALISGAASQLHELHERYEELSGKNFWKNAWYYTRKGFVFVTAGAAGLAIGAIGAALGAGPVALYGVKAAEDIYEEMDVSPPILDDTDSLMNTINELQKGIDDNLHALVVECQKRHATLQTLSTLDL